MNTPISAPESAPISTPERLGASPRPRAVVFAYHDVGVRGLQVLLACGIEVVLVVTHQDNPQETIWFDSVAALCLEHGIPAITPDSGKDAALLAAVTALAPDFIFSMYYRHMLPMTVLQQARRGAFNLHGSLLPKYRGRVPVNWAVLHGETEAGVSLHQMTAKADAGYLLGQVSVPILPDDTAHRVFGKLTVASEQLLWRVIPQLLAGCAPQLPNDIASGSYFGGRKPEDGRIDWKQGATEVYNLHRAVAPPYPGAFTEVAGQTLVIGRARRLQQPEARLASLCRGLPPGLAVVEQKMIGICGDAGLIHITELLLEGQAVSCERLAALLAQAAAAPVAAPTPQSI
jgi:methionyl-tRNA formyltransferase